MPQSGPILSLHNLETTSPRGPDNPQGVIPSVDPIALKWQQLASTDQQSPDFLPLLSFLTTGDNRSLTTRLRGNDARIALGALDEVGFSPVAVGERPADSDRRCTIPPDYQGR